MVCSSSAFGDHRELDVALQDAGDLVVGEQVGRIGHATR